MLFTSSTRCARATASSISSGYRPVVASKVTYGAAAFPKPASTRPKFLPAGIASQTRHVCQNLNSNVRAQLSRTVVPRPTKSSKNVRFVLVRHNSTAAEASQLHQPLTWNRYLALRRVRRRINLGSSVVTCAGVTAMGIFYLSNTDIEKLGAQVFGMDPFIVLGIATFAFAGAGWLMGPFVGGAVFNLAYRGVLPEIRVKERDFFTRIKKHRSDPSNSSLSNPIPDYYGEKIGSVKDYRTWLRDQRAFRLKRDRAS